jgi:hypothetical protein
VTREKFKDVDYSLGDLDNNMKASDNFMEKYQPVRFLNQIVDTMSTVLDKKKIQRLQDYQEAKHKELMEIVALDDGNPLNLKKHSPETFLKYTNQETPKNAVVVMGVISTNAPEA